MAEESSLAIDIRDQPLDQAMIVRMSQWPTLPDRYQGDPAAIHAAVLVGAELGIKPMEALNSLYLVNGQVSMSGKLMSALVHRQGHELRASIVKQVVTVEAWRRDPYTHELNHQGSVTFGPEDAERANLDQKETYLAYPTVMMTWRALSQCCRIYFADVLSGVAYVPDEVNIDAPLEMLDVDEDLASVTVEGVNLDAENAVAEVVNTLDADVVA